MKPVKLSEKEREDLEKQIMKFHNSGLKAIAFADATMHEKALSRLVADFESILAKKVEEALNPPRKCKSSDLKYVHHFEPTEVRCEVCGESWIEMGEDIRPVCKGYKNR